MNASNKIVLLTASGDRGKTINLVTRWIEQQTVQHGDWIIVDDSAVKYTLPTHAGGWKIHHVYRGACLEQDHGLTSQSKNYLIGIQIIKSMSADIVIMIGDDDYYASTYVEDMMHYMEGVDVAGSTRAIYIHPEYGLLQLGNKNYSAMESTAMRTGEPLLIFRDVCGAMAKEPESMYWVDKRFWDAVHESRLTCRLFAWESPTQYLMYNLKGHASGRPGIGGSHRKKGIYANVALEKYIPEIVLSEIKEAWA